MLHYSRNKISVTALQVVMILALYLVLFTTPCGSLVQGLKCGAHGMCGSCGVSCGMFYFWYVLAL